MPRRLALLTWARETGSWIIEDDYASEFRYSGRPLASLQGLDDAGRTIYIGTLDRALFPGLRIGYLVVPQSLLRAFVSARYLIDRQPSSLNQTVVAEFMRQGYFAAHIRRTRLQYRDQRDGLVAELTRRAGDNLTIDVPDQGMHLLAYLRHRLSDVEIEQAASQCGVIVRAIRPMYKKARARSGLMLGFRAGSRLRQSCRRPPGSPRSSMRLPTEPGPPNLSPQSLPLIFPVTTSPHPSRGGEARRAAWSRRVPPEQRCPTSASPAVDERDQRSRRSVPRASARAAPFPAPPPSPMPSRTRWPPSAR